MWATCVWQESSCPERSQGRFGYLMKAVGALGAGESRPKASLDTATSTHGQARLKYRTTATQIVIDSVNASARRVRSVGREVVRSNPRRDAGTTSARNPSRSPRKAMTIASSAPARVVGIAPEPNHHDRNAELSHPRPAAGLPRVWLIPRCSLCSGLPPPCDFDPTTVCDGARTYPGTSPCAQSPK